MLQSIKARLGRDDEQGFTLIELMVVVLIIAILLAIAIPTFLGARNTANARGAQSDLRNALTAEQTFWTNNQSFTVTATDLNPIEPNLTWVAAAPTKASAANTVATFMSSDGSMLWLQAYGKDGNCYTQFQNNEPGASGTVTGYYSTAASSAGACTAPTVTAAPTIENVGANKVATAGDYGSSW